MADWQGNAEPEDYADESQYCEHGTYVGNWATGDYMCSWCEDGTPWAEYVAIMQYHANRLARRRAANAWWDGLNVPAIKAFNETDCYQSVVIGTLITMSSLMVS